MLAWCLALLLASANGSVARGGTESPSLDRVRLPVIDVAVLAPTNMRASLVTSICAEAAAIWVPAGITFAWHRAASTAEADTFPLAVTIDDGSMGVKAGQTALGWISFTANDPDRSIHLSRAGAEDLLVQMATVERPAIGSHETLLGRALGRALSHELGHYLLKSRVHTPRGLMRATLPAYDFFAAARLGFELSAAERITAIRRVEQDAFRAGTH
jgi:hypothetical protein